MSLAAQGITLHISGMKLPVEEVLLRAGQLQGDKQLRLYRTDAETIASLSAPPAPELEAHK
jgi:SulP family sulfate permease